MRNGLVDGRGWFRTSGLSGAVNVREVTGYRTELTPFGGLGDSGLGVNEVVREAMRALSTTRVYTPPWS